MVTGKRTDALPEVEMRRMRALAQEVRAMKMSAYDSITWESAMNVVARRSEPTASAYYRSRILLEYFINEEHALSSLDVFLESLDDAVENLREYEQHYSITEEERVEIREKCGRCLNLLGTPRSEKSAHAVYHLQIDRLFTCIALEDLLSSIDALSGTLRQWFPAAYPETHLIAGSASQVKAAAELLTSPCTLKEFSEKSDSNVTTLAAVLHRFVATRNFRVARKGRQNTYAFATSVVDVDALRWEWAWLWAIPHKRLTFKSWKRWTQ